MAILQAEHVGFSYEQGRMVLRDINAEFEQGKVYAILGASGCGKTTLLSLLGGLDVPGSGRILFQGRPVEEIGYEHYRHNDVCFVFQNYNLVEYMTAEENVRLVFDAETSEVLTKVGLQPDEQKRNVLKLSGGQQQRVAIARALASPAPIILADEPTGNLDEETADAVMQLLVDQAYAFHKCAIIVTHSPKVAEMADEVLRISHGVIQL